MKQKTSYNTSYYLSLPEVLIALSICSITNPIIEKTIRDLEKLRGCEAHASYMLDQSELNALNEIIHIFVIASLGTSKSSSSNIACVLRLFDADNTLPFTSINNGSIELRTICIFLFFEIIFIISQIALINKSQVFDYFSYVHSQINKLIKKNVCSHPPTQHL